MCDVSVLQVVTPKPNRTHIPVEVKGPERNCYNQVTAFVANAARGSDADDTFVVYIQSVTEFGPPWKRAIRS